MSILKHLNWKWLTTVPYALGDRYYTQDLVRDFRFLQDVVGNLAYDTFGQTIPRKISGGVVTKGAGDTLNITLGRGWVAHSVEIPDTFASLPPSKMSADVTGVPVAWSAQTNLALPLATLDGVAVNYVKVRYLESDGNTRVRAKTTGTYSYETVPSYQFVVDTVAPTIYDLVLTTFVGTAGGAFTIADPTITYPYWETLSALPIGASIDYSGVSIPYGWLKEDGASLLRASYASLWDKLHATVGTCTISNASPAIVTLNTHGLITGDCIHLTTDGGLPTGLSVNTNYYVVYINANTFNLATSYANALAGTKINTSSAGSGTHTLLWVPWGSADATHFNIPDMGGLSSEGSSQQSYASWSSAEYLGRLGQYKQDQMQRITASITSSYYSLMEWGAAGVGAIIGSGAFSVSSAGARTKPLGDISVQGINTISFNSANSPNARASGTTEGKTATPRAGKFKIIKVI